MRVALHPPPGLVTHRVLERPEEAAGGVSGECSHCPHPVWGQVSGQPRREGGQSTAIESIGGGQCSHLRSTGTFQA